MDTWPNVILDCQGHGKGQKGVLVVLKMEISAHVTSLNTVTLGKEWKFEMVN
jgi:hypothetical protein